MAGTSCLGLIAPIPHQAVPAATALRAGPERGGPAGWTLLESLDIPAAQEPMRYPRGTVGTENSNYEPPTYGYLNRYARAYTHT